MIAKINRFELFCENSKYGNKEIVHIMDNKEHTLIMDFRTDDKELNLRLAKICLDELNKEFGEDD